MHEAELFRVTRAINSHAILERSTDCIVLTVVPYRDSIAIKMKNISPIINNYALIYNSF